MRAASSLGVSWALLIGSCLWPLVCGAQNLYSTDISFLDEQGKTVHLSDWKGRNAILTMEYSTCRFMCSTTVSKLRQTQAAADKRNQDIDFIIISLDPKNDSPASWSRYRQERELNRPNWHFLTSSVNDVALVAHQLDIHYWYEGEHLLHDFRLLRTNKEGRITHTVDSFDTDVEKLLE